MHHSEQCALTRRLLDLKKARRNENHGKAIAIPSSTYLDPYRHEAERELIAHSPMLVGLTQDMPEPGDFLTRDYGGFRFLSRG